jgi:DNA adenine methylase
VQASFLVANGIGTNPDPKLSPKMAKPFLKWAGGKTQLLNQLNAHFPIELSSHSIKRYIEPFVGGGAIFFHVAQHFNIGELFLLDVNPELILAYQTLKLTVDDVVERLQNIERTYHSLDTKLQAEYYYETRSSYNQNRANIDYETFTGAWIDRTAQIIFLNRTCFNGLFRVNSNGAFNVPFGRYKNPTICDPNNLRAVSNVLQRTSIIRGDFICCEPFVDMETFVYFDPPYRPVSKTSNFTSYSTNHFNDSEQRRLAHFYRRLDNLKAKLMLSNSDPRHENPGDTFFEEIYAGYRIERLSASRLINCDATKRGPITELLVMNY